MHHHHFQSNRVVEYLMQLKSQWLCQTILHLGWELFSPASINEQSFTVIISMGLEYPCNLVNNNIICADKKKVLLTGVPGTLVKESKNKIFVLKLHIVTFYHVIFTLHINKNLLLLVFNQCPEGTG